MGGWMVVSFLAGLLALGAGLWDVRTRSRLERIGVRAAGVVVRVDSKRTDEGARMYTPVVEFADASGVLHQVRSSVSSTGRPPAVGASMPVIHPPGQPEKARLDTRREKMGGAIGIVAGAIFLAVGIYLAAR
jgi:hypothetical protein